MSHPVWDQIYNKELVCVTLVSFLLGWVFKWIESAVKSKRISEQNAIKPHTNSCSNVIHIICPNNEWFHLLIKADSRSVDMSETDPLLASLQPINFDKTSTSKVIDFHCTFFFFFFFSSLRGSNYCFWNVFIKISVRTILVFMFYFKFFIVIFCVYLFTFSVIFP